MGGFFGEHNGSPLTNARKRTMTGRTIAGMTKTKFEVRTVQRTVRRLGAGLDEPARD